MKDVELKVRDDMLTLRGEKREESERKDKDRHVSERRYGSFQRSLRLPPDADAGQVEADLRERHSPHHAAEVRNAPVRGSRSIEIRGG